MKIKKISMLLSVLAFVLLTSVGFAAWVITGDATGNAEGNITTETVVDNRIKMTVELVEVNEGAGTSIHFGKPATTNSEGAWLKADSSAKVENLSVNVEITITNWSDIKDRINVNGKIVVAAVDSEAGKKYSDAQTYEDDQLLGALPSEITIDSSKFVSGDGVVVETLTFTWGSAFENQNPYTYYNTGKTSSEYGDEALARLQHLATNLEGVKFKVTVTATASDK